MNERKDKKEFKITKTGKKVIIEIGKARKGDLIISNEKNKIAFNYTRFLEELKQ